MLVAPAAAPVCPMVSVEGVVLGIGEVPEASGVVLVFGSVVVVVVVVAPVAGVVVVVAGACVPMVPVWVALGSVVVVVLVPVCAALGSVVAVPVVPVAVPDMEPDCMSMVPEVVPAGMGVVAGLVDMLSLLVVGCEDVPVPVVVEPDVCATAMPVESSAMLVR